MTDADTTAAIKALTHRVELRDQALRDGEDCPDAGPFAQEFILAMLGYGWRLTEAKAKPDPHADGSGTPQSPEVAELVARVRAEREAAAAAWKAQSRDGAA
jgi:hypothetical protein